YARKTLLLQHVQVLAHVAARRKMDRCEEEHSASLGKAEHTGHYIVDRVALHHFSAGGGDGAADAGEEQFQVIVDLGARAHGAPRIARHHLLLDRDRRAYADDPIDIGFLQPAEELACVAAEAFHVAALPFGVQRIEGQAALPAAAEAGDHHQFAARN